MNILHTIASTAESHGGTSRTVTQLCSSLALRGENVRLLTVSSPGDRLLLPDDGVKSVLAEAPKGMRRLVGPHHGFADVLMDMVRKDAPEIIHDHGAWLSTNRAAARIARSREITLAVSTRGMFSPWALRNGLAKKRLAWHAYQRRLLRGAAMLHATSDAEVTDLRRLGMTQPIALVPNGVVIPPNTAARASSRRAVLLSRLHPVKNIEALLRAWHRVRPRGWTLHLVGHDRDGYSATIRRIISELKIGDDVVLAGPVDEPAKWSAYAAAELFVLPSHSENFGMAIAEALASGLPVITTTGTPWGVIAQEACGWWVAPSVDGIAAALAAATSLSTEERASMGARGREIVRTRFSWQRAASEMMQAYHYVTSGGTRPACVHLG